LLLLAPSSQNKANRSTKISIPAESFIEMCEGR
jgi:hypothetical protein